MARLFVRHEVADFTTWKRAYDDFDQERRGLGVVGDGVYQADDNPNHVTAYHDFDSMDAAKAFASSNRLREVMVNAGVVGVPDIWFATKA